MSYLLVITLVKLINTAFFYRDTMEVNLAVFGDIHGHQDLMYKHALAWQESNKKPIDAILQVGDFETMRSEKDFEHYYAPSKYHRLSDFVDYYSGEKTAPFPTFFIAGNHESWDSLKNYQEGSFIAPNFYYLGRAGVANFKGINIAGLSGIYNAKKYRSERSEEPNYDWKYYNEHDIHALMQKQFDILLLHSWLKPLCELNNITNGEIPKSLEHTDPSPSLKLVQAKQPKYVFMGHMHSSYLEANLGKSRIIGLSQFDENLNPDSFKVLSFKVNE